MTRSHVEWTVATSGKGAWPLLGSWVGLVLLFLEGGVAFRGSSVQGWVFPAINEHRCSDFICIFACVLYCVRLLWAFPCLSGELSHCPQCLAGPLPGSEGRSQGLRDSRSLTTDFSVRAPWPSRLPRKGGFQCSSCGQLCYCFFLKLPREASIFIFPEIMNVA